VTAAPAPAGSLASRRLAFGLFAVAFGTNVPTPLLLIYQHQLHLSASVLTAVFGAYAAGLVPTLFFCGPLSDRIGRRPVALPFAALALLTTALFIPAGHLVALLFVARFGQGVVSGAVFSVCSAWLAELVGPEHAGTAGRRAAVAMTAGFSLGPLTSGLLAQFAPGPTTLPYLVHLSLMAFGLRAIWRVPETLIRATVRRPLRGPILQPGARPMFLLTLAPSAVCVYGFAAVPTTIIPLLLPAQGDAVAFAGLIGAVTLGCGTLVAPQARHLRAWAAPTAAALGAVGFALCLLAVEVRLLTIALAGAVLLGAGSGLMLAAGLAVTQRLALPEARGTLSSVFYACAYVGFAGPLLVSLVDSATGPAVSLGGLAILTALFAGWLTVWVRTFARQAVPTG
jgi:MFS family permease